MIRRLKSVREHVEQKLRDPYFKELYELEQEKMKLAKLVLNYRIQNNLTQEELANKLGITQQYISKIEEGIFSSIKDVAKILLAIGYRIEFTVIKIPNRISEKIRKAAMDERLKEIDKKEHIIKLLHDELINILGEYNPLKLGKTQNRIIFLGLYGAGKTTTIAKIGNYFAKRGNKVALIGLDVLRPAA